MLLSHLTGTAPAFGENLSWWQKSCPESISNEGNPNRDARHHTSIPGSIIVEIVRDRIKKMVVLLR